MQTSQAAFNKRLLRLFFFSLAGAHGLCAIKTIPSFFGFDLKTLRPKPDIGGMTSYGGYSAPGIKAIALRAVITRRGQVSTLYNTRYGLSDAAVTQASRRMKVVCEHDETVRKLVQRLRQS